MKTLTLLKSRFVLLLLATVPAALLLASDDDTRPSTAPPPSRPMEQSYDILLQRSIFARDHKAAVTVHATPTTTHSDTASPPPVNETYVLRGVTIEDGQPVAHFGRTSGPLVHVRVGDPLEDGQITAIDRVNYTVDYQAGGKTVRLLVNQALDGGVPSAGPTIATTAPTDPATEKTTRWTKKWHQKE